MSVITTLRIDVDPAKFEATMQGNAEAVSRILELAKSHGVIAHRFYGAEGEVVGVDEWPDAESFQTFLGAAEGEIGPLMQDAGVTSEPDVKVWRKLDTGDELGWG